MCSKKLVSHKTVEHSYKENNTNSTEYNDHNKQK